MTPKFFIASDIHGAAGYCQVMVDRFKESGCDYLLLLGDLLYHGPRNDLPKNYQPKAVITLLNDLAPRILCIEGNCESEVDRTVLDFPMQSESMLLFLEGQLFFVSHGHKYGEFHPMFHTPHFMIGGHTHIPKCRVYNGYVYLNPGSVSLPKEGADPSYMLIEGDRITWHSLTNNRIFREESISKLAAEMTSLL
ncbi:MAG: phosphodiesterase [Clostridia bacterium]|nr:phosphodiesterase [Clostridia bacterium]